MIRQPAFSRISRYSKRDRRRSPVAMGVRRSRCSCAIAFAFSNGIGSSNQPGRERAQRVVEHHRRARRQELAALDEDLAVGTQALARTGDRAPRRGGFRRPRRRAGPRARTGRHLKAVKPRRTASRAPANASSRRPRALQPVARVAAKRRAHRAAEQSRDGHAEPLAFEVPQRDVERGQRGLEHGAAAPAPRVIEAVPVPLGAGGVLPDEVRRVFADRGLDRLDRAVQRRLAPADEALVGGDAHEQPVAPVDPVLERVDAGDLHEI